MQHLKSQNFLRLLDFRSQKVNSGVQRKCYFGYKISSHKKNIWIIHQTGAFFGKPCVRPCTCMRTCCSRDTPSRGRSRSPLPRRRLRCRTRRSDSTHWPAERQLHIKWGRKRSLRALKKCWKCNFFGYNDRLTERPTDRTTRPSNQPDGHEVS